MSFITDPGHGGKDSGAINSLTGDTEKEIVLDFSLRYNRHFEALTGIKPHLTRDDDSFVELSDRAAMANRLRLKLLSFHCNASNTQGHGVEAFTSVGQTNSDPWATALLETYAEQNPGVAKRYDLSDGDPDKEARFTVLTATKAEAVLFELGFIDNPEDIQFLSDPDWRERNSYALARATARHFGLLKGEAPAFFPVNSPASDSEVIEPVRILSLAERLDHIRYQVDQIAEDYA
ncbi:N-acetylmuramoyl-L-alanine amidase [Roseibacillus persicicus]|uniref:N-acetylmuramoyl-L-alanine amidase family protein n=1 Tax=Roseibacillus persicicus TaxID=454148 RepID=UPI00398B81D7